MSWIDLECGENRRFGWEQDSGFCGRLLLKRLMPETDGPGQKSLKAGLSERRIGRLLDSLRSKGLSKATILAALQSQKGCCDE